MFESVMNTGARFMVRPVQPVYTTYGTKRRTDASHDALHIRARESGAVKVTVEGDSPGGSQDNATYPGNSIEPSLTVA